MKMAPDLDHFFKTAVELFVYLFLQCGYGQSRFPLFLCYSMIVYKKSEYFNSLLFKATLWLRWLSPKGQLRRE